jgi:hypothetical protein
MIKAGKRAHDVAPKRLQSIRFHGKIIKPKHHEPSEHDHSAYPSSEKNDLQASHCARILGMRTKILALARHVCPHSVVEDHTSD